MNKKSIVLSAAALAVLIFGLILFGSYNGTRNGIISRENQLNAQYLDNQNELSSYTATIRESLGVANTNADKVDQIIQDAVKGRYQNSSTGATDSKAMINAIAEAYPDLKETSISYQKVQDAVTAGRTAYKNKQTTLLDMLRDYDTYRQSGVFHSAIANMVGAPTDNLVARVGSNTWTGKDAENKMYQIVLTQDAVDSYTTGIDKGVNTGPTSTSTPSK